MKLSLLSSILPVLLASSFGTPGILAGAFPTGEETTFSDSADLLPAEEEDYLAVKIAQQHEVTGINFGFSSVESVATVDVDTLASDWAELNEAGNSWVYVLVDADGAIMIREGSNYIAALSESGRSSAVSAITEQVAEGNLLAGLDQGLSMYGQLMPSAPPVVPEAPAVAPEATEDAVTDGPTIPSPVVLDEEGLMGESAVATFWDEFETARQQNLNLGLEAIVTTDDPYAYLEQAYTGWTAENTLGGANAYMLYVQEDERFYLKASPLYLSIVPVAGVEATEARMESDLAENPRRAVINAVDNLTTMMQASLSGGKVEYPDVDSSNAPRAEILEDRFNGIGTWLLNAFGGILPLLIGLLVFSFLIQGFGRALKKAATGAFDKAEDARENVQRTAADVERELREAARQQEQNIRVEMERAAQEVADDIQSRADAGLDDTLAAISVDGYGSLLPSNTVEQGHTAPETTPLGDQSEFKVDPFKPIEFKTFEFEPIEVKPIEFTGFGSDSGAFKPLFGDDSSTEANSKN